MNGTFVVRVVDEHEFSSDLPPTCNNDVTFFVNAINVVFESLKEGVEKDGVNILAPFKFKLPKNKTMMLVDRETNNPISDKSLAIIQIE